MSLKKQKTSVDSEVEKLKPSHVVHGDVHWCSHYGKQYGGSSKLKIKLQYDPATHLQKNWNQDSQAILALSCLWHESNSQDVKRTPTSMGKEEVVYTYNGISLSLKKENLQYATTWVSLEHITLSDVSQSRRDKHWMIPVV